MQYIWKYQSPLGGMTLASDGGALTGLWFDGQKYFGSTLCEEREERTVPVLDETVHWLDLYFSGILPEKLPKLSPGQGEFRNAVWKILLEIPCGQTMTYGEIAGRIAAQRGLDHMSAQAVGGAVGHNPVSILIPCHRVLGSDGSLTGYAGGVEKKRWLLALERRMVEKIS